MELNTKIVNLLNLIKELDYEEQAKINIILKRISKLDESNQIEFLKHVISSSLIKLDFIEKDMEKFDCEANGHVFTEWESTFLSKYDDENELVKYWKRRCTRCDLIDVSSIDPNEIEKGVNKL